MEDPSSLRTEEQSRRQLDRVGAFSDGVFAVAITLLVLNIEVPDVSDSDLAASLDDLIPNVQAYFIAFAVIGLFWLGHHLAWARFTSSTRGLVWANLLLLSLIALMPFTTALIGEYGGEAIAVTIFAANVGLAAIADSFVDRVAYREGIVEDLSGEEVRGQVLAGWMRPAIFLASIPVAWLIGTTVAMYMWLLLFAVTPLARRWAGTAT
ncbi:MAG: TMEM175 family protein [Solirubrobacterales bacterium]